MENPTSSRVALSSLLCQETERSCLGEEQDPSLTSLIACDGCSDSEEYVRLLLEKEKINSSGLCGEPSSSTFMGDFTKIARLEAVNFILTTRELLGFQFQTAYLSVTYLDRFLSLRILEAEKPWATQLLSVGCMSLAVKMQESEVWALSSFQVGDFKFDARAIQRMELLILNTLGWKMSSITPFAFLPYFINVIFTKPPPWSTLTRILELIMAIMQDVRLMDHYPSAIAFAAVLLSFDQRLTRKTMELEINAMPCGRFVDLEDVSNCYHIMQQSERDKSKITKLLASPDFSPISLSRVVSFQNSPDTSLISSKRKRLAFDDTDDQNQGFPDKQQRESDT